GLIALCAGRVRAGGFCAALPVRLVAPCLFAAGRRGEARGFLALALAGPACSASLPLSISFGGNEFPRLAAVIAGELIAFYQLGYGVAAFGIRPLHDQLGFTLAAIFAAATIVALPLAVVSAP